MQATNKVTLSFTPEVSQVSRDVERDMLAMIGLKAPVYRSDKRAPISTVAVIDRSGSMSGSPLALVKDSLHFVINNLTADDKLGIVTFDDSVAVSLPLTLMDVNGKDRATRAVNSVAVGGSTNLCGGLVKGIEMVSQLKEDGHPVSSVLLFTDGAANVGYQSPNDILRAMTDKEFASKSGASDGPGSRIVPSGYGPSVRGRGATMSTRGRGSVPSPVNNYAPGPIQQQMMQQVPQQQQQSFFDSRISQIPPPQPVSVQQMTQQVPQQASPQFFPPPPASSAPATSAIPQPTLIPTPMAVEPSEPVEEKDDKEKTSGATLPCIVNTFGFGSGHQAELLKGNGLYRDIETKDMIPEAFTDCLADLLSVAGQNLSVKIVCKEGVKIKSIYTSFRQETVEEGVSYIVHLPDIQSEELKNILVRLELPSWAGQEAAPLHHLMDVTLDYFDCIGSLYENVFTSCLIERPEDAKPETRNIEIDKNMNRILVAKAMEEADRHAKLSALAQAREVINKAISQVEESVSASDEYCKLLVEDLKTSLTGLQDVQVYSCRGSKMLNNNAQAHAQQRVNAPCSSAFGRGGSAAYRTPQQVQMQQQQVQWQQQQPQPQPPQPNSFF